MLLNKRYRPISYNEFWHEMDEYETSLGMGFLSKEDLDICYGIERNPFEVF